MSLKPVDCDKINGQYSCFHGQIGNGIDIPVFRGTRFQKGYGIGSLLSGLFRSALPVIKKGAMSLGKSALKTGLNIAKDTIEGKSLKNSISNNLRQTGHEIIGNIATNTLHNSKQRRNIRSKPRARKRISNESFKKRGGKRRKRDIFG